MHRHHATFALFVALAPACEHTSAPELELRDGPLAGPRPGPPFAWEGAITVQLGATPFEAQNEASLDTATGGLSLRLPLHAWHDRLPGVLALAYESNAPAARRFRLDVDRELVENETSIVVEDAWLRPLVFAKQGSELVAPPGIFAELVPTPGGGFDLREHGAPDVVDRFAPSNGTCCFLAARIDTYGNAITIDRDAENHVVAVTPATAPAVELVWADGVLSTIELPTGTTGFAYTDGKLSSVTPAHQSGALVFEYGEGDPSRLARVMVPGGATLDITTDALGTTTALEVPGQRYEVTWTSSTQVDIVHTPGTPRTMIYAPSGELLEIRDADGVVALGWTDRALTSSTDKLGRTTTMTVDAHGHVTSRDVSGFHATYGWDDDRLVSIDELGTSYTMERNAQGRAITESWSTGAGTHERTHAWTPTGLLASTSELGITTTYVWNADDLLQRVEQNGITRQSFGYDDIGRLVTFTNGRGGTTTYEYANEGALVPATMTLPSGVTSSISADVPLEVTVTVQPPGADPSTSTTTYLGDGRVAGQRVNGYPVVDYTY